MKAKAHFALRHAKMVAPAVLTILAANIHPAAAASTSAFPTYAANPISAVIDNLQSGLILPIVEKVIGIAALAVCGFMAFQPDKTQMVKHVSGVALAGALGVGSVWILNNFVFNGGGGTAAGLTL